MVLPMSLVGLSCREASRIIGVSTRTLTRWRQAGEGPPWVKLGGATSPVRYPAAGLKAWQDARTNLGDLDQS